MDADSRAHKKHKGNKERKTTILNKESSKGASQATQKLQINRERGNRDSRKLLSPTSNLTNRGAEQVKILSNNQEEAEIDYKSSIIEERENHLLFNSEVDNLENYTPQKETNELKKILTKDMAKKSPPQATRKLCKFWQTPSGSKTSPFTSSSSHQSREMNLSTTDKVPIQEFQEFLNNDNTLESPMEEMSITNTEKDRLNFLTD